MNCQEGPHRNTFTPNARDGKFSLLLNIKETNRNDNSNFVVYLTKKMGEQYDRSQIRW